MVQPTFGTHQPGVGNPLGTPPFNYPVLTFPLDRFSGIRPFLRIVFVFEETVTAGRFPGCALISVALALYTDNAPRRAKPGTWG